MIICVRCVRSQKKYCFSLLSQKCVEYICCNKRCNFAISIMNFLEIDKVLEKLKREKLKIETV